MDFRKLTDEETAEFRQWARDNYQPGDPINEVWHPVVREECERMNNEQMKVGRTYNLYCKQEGKRAAVMMARGGTTRLRIHALRFTPKTDEDISKYDQLLQVTRQDNPGWSFEFREAR